MSADKETLRRVREGLDFHLGPGMKPFVEAGMKSKHGANWLHFASRAAGSNPGEGLDVYGLLKTILDNWNDVFARQFDRKTMHRVRGFASVAFEARNAVSHLSLPLTDAEALRYLDAMLELVRLIKGPQAEAAALKSLYDEQRGGGLEPTTASAAPAAQLDLAPPETPKGSLKPWIDVALPHPDVLAGRHKEAEFAADLFAVDAGKTTDDYASPASFFRITYLTEGLKRVLTTALERLSGGDGDPVIGLQTAFGGGKTHSMLALYHLARADDLSNLPGVAQMTEAAGVTGWKPAKVAVFVGSSKGTDTSLILEGGPQVRTLWGYIAWRLAGDAGLKIVAESEAAGTNPGSELMVRVFETAGPSIVLLDELVAYARQLSGERFEAFLSFIQSLTEAAKMAPGALVVGSLPESDAEVGGEKGRAALIRLEKVFGRVQSPWLPASGDETYEIIRRRLFQELDAEGEKARDDTAKAFFDMYKKNDAEFPPFCREPRYLELLKLSYPIHPELFDRLSKDWASLEKFQRTRGVLRLMANVVSVLWHERAKDPLITPGRVPVGQDKVRAGVLYPLDPGFGAVIAREVDSESALPRQMEINPTRRIGQTRAATRAARAVFLCTAPLVGQTNAGLTAHGLRLACAEPGDQLAIFGEALRELSERATYLHDDGGRYWFSTQPTLNRLADDLAKGFHDHEVDAQIVKDLAADALQKDRFFKVFAAPDEPAGVDEVDTLSLVILKPAHCHSGRGVAASPATAAVTDGLTRRQSSQRRHRNTLLFVAADEAQLDTAREATRKAMAWAAIAADDNLQKGLTQAQSGEVKDKAKNGRDGAVRAIRTAWSHMFYPVKTEATAAGSPFDLEHLSVAYSDRLAIPGAAFAKAAGDGTIKEKLGPDTLANAISGLWQERPHLALSELREWFSSYVYLPKVRDRVVLETSVREAVSKLDPAFAYADGFDEAAGAYKGLTWAKPGPTIFPDTAMIVRNEVALAQLDREGAAVKPTLTGAQPPGPSGTAPGVRDEVKSAGPVKPIRFYGTVELDPDLPLKAFQKIVESVVLELQRAPGSKVTLTLDVQADCPAGFPDEDVGVVRDNARQLKFNADSTGFGE